MNGPWPREPTVMLFQALRPKSHRKIRRSFQSFAHGHADRHASPVRRVQPRRLVNILAFRLRYFTGIITYSLNVTIYYFIWTAVYHNGQSIAGYNMSQMITYTCVGWIIRSFYSNTIDQEMAYEVIDGKIAMDLIKPVSVPWMWISRAMGESAFRLGLLTLPTALVIAFVFPMQGPASQWDFGMFLLATLGSFFLMAAIGFLIGTCAIPLKSILALVRAKQWLIELLSGLLLPMAFFPRSIRVAMAWLPFEHIAFTPLQIYLGKLSRTEALHALAAEWFWVVALLVLAHWWWNRCLHNLSIQGG